MRSTDSWPFRHYTAAVSIRENQRVAEIGQGSNPHWHQPTDLYSTYSDLDFRLGFNALQMTLGTVAQLAGASIASRVSVFGSGCPGSGGTPTLAAAAGQLPWTGETFTVELSSLPPSPANTPLGLLGASKTSWGPFSLPLSLGSIGMPGCSFFVSAQLAFTLINAGGVATWTIPIPNTSSLVGAHFYMQGLVSDPGVNPLGLTVTNAVDAEVGVR